MSKRVQLPPPDLDSISRIGASDDSWVAFPNGKKRRKASAGERSPKRSNSVSIRRFQSMPYIVNRIRGNRWRIEEPQKETECFEDCRNVTSRICGKEPCEASNTRVVDGDDKLSAFPFTTALTSHHEEYIAINVSYGLFDREYASFETAAGDHIAIQLENYILESLVPATLVLGENCDAFYCCENETVDQNISDLVGKLAGMGLREPAKPLPVENQNLLTQRVLFEVVSNLIYYAIPITAQSGFAENVSVHTEAMNFFQMEMTDILRLLWEGCPCLESICEILALFRRVSEDSSTSEFERECCLMARTFARLLDEVLYLLTDLERGDRITKGSIVRVYDAVLHRWWIGRVHNHGHGRGALIIPIPILNKVEEFPVLPKCVKMPSYFVCAFDPYYDSFLCKSEDNLKVAPMSPIIDLASACVGESTIASDPELTETWKTNSKSVEEENGKDLADMRHYLTVCKGFPQHGVRGGIKSWKKSCFEHAKYTQKLRQHVKYGKFAELILRQHPTTSPDDFDALMRTAWLLPEVSNSGIEIKSMKDLRKLNVFARMLSINRRARKDQRSKSRQNVQACTLCSEALSLTNPEATGYGVQCGTCKLALCIACIRSSALETAPRIFSSSDWVCSSCYKESDECALCEDTGLLIVCDGCNKDHCFPCADLTEDSIPDGDWFCKPCKEKSGLLGRRVRVLCSDGEKYCGAVSSWDRRLEEFKISLDCGDILHSSLSKDSWDVEVIDDPRKN